jgi:aspartate kinase
MSRIACKFGGTSVASAEQIQKVRAIVEADPRRRVVVVSAPGKRTSKEAKITDLLYLCQEMAEMRTDFSAPFGTVRERFLEIERDLGVDANISAALDACADDLRRGVTRDYVASRGEYFNAIIIAKYLGAELVDPLETILISASGRVDRKSYELLGEKLSDESKRYVLPGFYGRGPDGAVKTFSRGGSDISGAIAARAIAAVVYENWTDVSGLLMTDPRIVDQPRPLQEVTYRELRELSYMGASVMHDEATLPVREAGIPINIRNTNEPSHPGTRIVSELAQGAKLASVVAGIAGKRGFSMVCIEKTLMNKEVGFTHRLLGIFQRRGINVEHCPSSIDGINVILEKDALGGAGEEVIDEIRRSLEPDRVHLVEDLALIAVVGEGMSHTIGIAGRVFSCLAGAKVNVRVINQGASELNIIVGVGPDDFERAVQSLYAEFVTSQVRSYAPPAA